MVYKIAKITGLTLTLLSVLLLTSCTKTEKLRELRLYTWSQYFPEEFIKEFEQEAHVKVKVDYFSSNEQLLTKIQLSINSKEEGYDLIVPSDYEVKTMTELNLIKTIDHSKLSFLKDFDPAFTNPPYNPNLAHAIPLAIGTTGFAVNTKLLPKLDWKNITWKQALESPELKGKVTLLDDQKEVLQVALLIHGKNVANATEADVKEAFAYLKKHKENIRAFTEEAKPVIEAGECGLCHVFSGDAIAVGQKNSAIKYIVPKEGATIWSDNFAIPVNAINDDLAYAFMNKALSAPAAKKFMENINYRTANNAAKALLAKNFAEDTGMFPTAEQQKKFSYIVDKKELILLMDREWTELKSK